MPFQNVSRCCKKKLLIKILRAYTNYGNSPDFSIPPTRIAPAPRIDTKRKKLTQETLSDKSCQQSTVYNTIANEATNSTSTIHQDIITFDEIIEYSNESIFHGLLNPQPESTLKLHSTSTLASLCDVKALTPLVIQDTSRILDEATRSRCVLELSDPNTFLTDITINAFCVS